MLRRCFKEMQKMVPNVNSPTRIYVLYFSMMFLRNSDSINFGCGYGGFHSHEGTGTPWYPYSWMIWMLSWTTPISQAATTPTAWCTPTTMALGLPGLRAVWVKGVDRGNLRGLASKTWIELGIVVVEWDTTDQDDQVHVIFGCV